MTFYEELSKEKQKLATLSRKKKNEAEAKRMLAYMIMIM